MASSIWSIGVADGNIGWIDPELDPTRRTRRREA